MNPVKAFRSKNIAIDTAARREGFCAHAELFFVLDGHALFSYDGRDVKLDKMGLLVINRGTEYRYEGSSDLILASLELTGTTFETACDGMLRTIECDSSREDDEHHARLRALLRQMIVDQDFVRDDESTYARLVFDYYSLYYKLLETLVEFFMPNDQPLGSERNNPPKDSDRKERIERYLDIHYAETITLDALAEELYLSKGYLSRFFTKSFGVNFNHYVRELRLKRALNELLYTDKPITQISFDNGFSGSSYFNRAFKKKYGASPSEMRAEVRAKEHREQMSAESRKALDNRISRILDGKTEPFDFACESQTSECDVRESLPIKHCWNSVINVGSAADVLKTDIQEHIMMLHKRIGCAYIRFWNPFSSELLLDANETMDAYNFIRLDQVFDTLLSNGMKPFIVLEPKAERINKTLDDVIFRSDQKRSLGSVESWSSIVVAFMRHVTQRYGVEEVEDWILEIPFDGYVVDGEHPLDGYCSLFGIAQRVAREYAHGMKVGGPSLPSIDARIKGILMGLRERGHEPDFVSTVSYAYEKKEDAYRYFKRSGDEDYLIKDIERMEQAIIETGMRDVPLYLTEWNETVVDRNCLNDSCYRGAYIVKSMIEIDGRVSLASYYSGTDRRTDFFDSHLLLQGGNGLVTRDGIMKPAGFALTMLGGLAHYLVSSGDGFMVTTDRRRNYYIVAHNKRKLSYHYFKTEEDSIAKELLSQCFEDDTVIERTIVLAGMENGSYQVRTRQVNSHVGSVLDLWRELGYSDALSSGDVRYIEHVCEPHLQIETVEIREGRMPLKLVMEPNEIAFMEIRCQPAHHHEPNRA